MKKVKIAVVGVGNIGEVHINAYKKVKEAEIYAICDVSEKSLNEIGDRFCIEKRYTNIDTMLSELPELDAVDICVWNRDHASFSIKALNAGKHVLCEKPMAYSVKEAEQMLEAAKRNNKLLMIGFVKRFSDETKIVKDFVDKDYLGDIYYTKAQYVRRHGNPGGWFADKERSGGGPVIDLGVHVIDVIRYLMGNPKPISVYAVAGNKLGNRSYLKTNVGWIAKDAKPNEVSTVEDFATALIRYDNGAVTHLETSFDINGKDAGHCQLLGTKAGIDMTGDIEKGIKIYGEYNNYLTDFEIKTENYKESCDMFEAEMAHFVECVANGTECIAKAEDGVVVMKILEAIYLSAATGHEVVLN